MDAGRIRDPACQRGADRRADANGHAEQAEAQVEVGGAAGQVGGDQRQHHSEHCRTDPGHRLAADQQVRTRQHCQQHAAHRQRQPTQQQHLPAPGHCRTTADPGRRQCHHRLRHHDAGADDQVAQVAGPHRHRCAGQRQHRRVRKVEQHHAGGENQQTPVAEQLAQPLPVERAGCRLPPGMRAAADRRQRGQCRHAQSGGQPEHRPAGQVQPAQPHHGGGEAVADRAETGIAPEPLAQFAVPDEVQADRGDRWRHQATGDPVQHLGEQYRQFRRP